ncbi:MAG: hypothetical protein AAGC46_19270 [Solirubrobacteraceae bacterium]|nr:hypothetical protein [Patulibacter sp.]
MTLVDLDALKAAVRTLSEDARSDIRRAEADSSAMFALPRVSGRGDRLTNVILAGIDAAAATVQPQDTVSEEDRDFLAEQSREAGWELSDRLSGDPERMGLFAGSGPKRPTREQRAYARALREVFAAASRVGGAFRDGTSAVEATVLTVAKELGVAPLLTDAPEAGQ